MNIKEKFGLKVKSQREEKGKRNVSIEIIEKIITALETDFATFFNDKGFKK